MANQFDYLLWRGDLTFSADKFNEVDGSILAMLSYIDYDSISHGKEITLSDAGKKYCPDKKYDSVKLGLIIPSKKINKIFCDAAQSKRFEKIRISDYEWKTSIEENCQFAAVTFHLPGGRAVISFRGTDDTLAGWREDCCLSYLSEIPAQRMAVDYFQRMCAKYTDEKFILVGHSKGGNIAAYAAIRSSQEAKKRLVRVYSYDGPGLRRRISRSKEFDDLKRKLVFILPQSSFIGTMFDVNNQYTVVNGTARGAYQHDLFTWEISGAEFVHLPELSDRGKRNREQFLLGMRRMSLAEKKEFVHTMFSIIDSTGAKSLTDFTSGTFKKLATLIRNYNGLDKEKRDLMLALVMKLFDFKML